MESKLTNFLVASENTRSKEVLLNYRLFYDLKLAAAVRGYDLSIYVPDVDREGFDIIVDDGGNIRKLQVKTVLKNSKTFRWNIHKTVLRPGDELCEKLGFEPSPSGTGIQGGIILMEINPKETSLEVVYHYTDIFVISALNLEIVKRRPKIKKEVLKKFLKELRQGRSHEKIKISKSFFVKAKSAEHLLALMGLYSRFNHTWWHHLLIISENRFKELNEQELPAPIPILKEYVANELIQLTNNLVVTFNNSPQRTGSDTARC